MSEFDIWGVIYAIDFKRGLLFIEDIPGDRRAIIQPERFNAELMRFWMDGGWTVGVKGLPVVDLPMWVRAEVKLADRLMRMKEAN